MSAKDSRLWARFTVTFADNPKVAGLSDAAFRALVEMILWSTQELTDGVLPASIVNRRWNAECIAELMHNHRTSPSLWRDEEGDYHLHGFLDHQQSAAEVRATRERKRAAARARWDKRKPSGDAEPMHGALQDAGHGAMQNRCTSDADIDTDTDISTHSLSLVSNAREDTSTGKRRRSPSTPIPDDWQPTSTHQQRAASLGVDCDREAEAFRAHALAHDRRCVRWDAAFTQWLLKAQGHKPTGPTTPDLVIHQPATPEEQAALTTALFTPTALQDILREEAS